MKQQVRTVSELHVYYLFKEDVKRDLNGTG